MRVRISLLRSEGWLHQPFGSSLLPLSHLPHIIESPSAHCGGNVSSSPHRTRLLSVTESVVLPPDSGVHQMPQAYRSEPSLLPIERPRCSKCQGRMMLARIERGPAHADLLTFECPKCEHIQKTSVEDPMELSKAGWIKSDLNPPK
jgi:hypothetical protein